MYVIQYDPIAETKRKQKLLKEEKKMKLRKKKKKKGFSGLFKNKKYVNNDDYNDVYNNKYRQINMIDLQKRYKYSYDVLN